MGRLRYDAEHLARWYDEYGEREWARFDQSAMDRVNLEVHRRLLEEWIRPGQRVLEVGAGPGRFTLELARIGARVVVGDISPRQLELHAEKTASIADAIEDRVHVDVVDLSRFADGEFDAVVCYGGPISYVLDQADLAVAELLRVTSTGGHALLTVMSLLGAARAYFGAFPELIEQFGWDRAVAEIFATGDLSTDVNAGHVMRLYRWSELEALLRRHPCRVVAASASSYLAVGNDEVFESDPRFLELEIAACREPGALDGGTHIVAVVEKTG